MTFAKTAAARWIALLALSTATPTNAWLTRPMSQRPTSIATARTTTTRTTTRTTTTTLLASKFSQPSFAQPAFTGNNKPNKKSNEKQHPTPRKFGADSKIASLHAQRVKTAGRVGTKRYVDPCKVFFGNLPFDTTEKDLEAWLEEKMGMPAHLLLSQVKIIRDWKTSQSKGYGFAVFTEAIYGTVAIDKCNGKVFNGRTLSVDQGKKKETTQVIVKKTKKPPVDAEEAAIQAGMSEAARMDPREALMLRQLDPDLVDDDFDSDEGLFEDEDLDDEGFDGFYVEDEDGANDDLSEDGTPMNRKRRREMARKRKRRKPSSKGFGSVV